MSQNIGRILLVDDQYDEVISKAVNALVQKGMSVQYWDGKGDLPETIRNVRVVILDLDLARLGTRTGGPEFYSSAAKALKKIPGPFVVIIMALDINTNDPSDFLKYYEETFEPLCGVIAEQGLSKDEESADPSRLESVIADSLAKNKIFGLILIWEHLVDNAKDKAFADLISKQIERTVVSLIKSLSIDFGEESAARELANVIMRLIARRLVEHKQYERLNQAISEFHALDIEKLADYPSKEDLLLYNKLMFYVPAPEEDVWTGDIFLAEGTSKYDKYALVLTPVCQFVQSKTQKVLVCFAFQVDHKCFDDPEYPPNKIDPAVTGKRNAGAKLDEIRNCLKSRYITRKEKLPDSLSVIWNFKGEDGIQGICLDFNNVKSVETETVKAWKRVCRIDSPFIEEIQEKYSRFASHVGTLDINRSPDELRASVEKLKKVEPPGE